MAVFCQNHEQKSTLVHFNDFVFGKLRKLQFEKRMKRKTLIIPAFHPCVNITKI